MSRARHIYRAGDGVNDQRDLQLNGQATPREPQDISAGEFFAPGEAYTGFAADGNWYQAGAQVAAGLSDDFTQPLNTHKWTETGQAAATSSGRSVAFLWSSADAWSLVGNRWHLKGDFCIRVAVRNCAVPATDDPLEDNAVWLGVSRLSDPAAFATVKRCRTSSFSGFAVETATDAFGVPYSAPGVASFDLIIARTSGAMALAFTAGGETHQLVAAPWPGIVVVQIGARTRTGSDPWGFTLPTFTHDLGWTNYSHRASWAQESEGGLLLDDFAGDEIDPELWTSATTANATVTCVHGSGLKLHAEGAIGGLLPGDEQVGAARTTLPAVSGDFDLLVDFNFDEAAVVDPAGGSDIFQVRLASWADRPSIDVVVYHDLDGTYVARVLTRDSDTSEVVVGDSVSLSATGGRRVMRIAVERRGVQITARLTENDAILFDTTLDTLFVPLAPSLAAVAIIASSTFDTYVTLLRIDTPCAQELAAWPARFYAATMTGGYGDGLEVGEVTLVDVATRLPFWRAFGHGVAPVEDTAHVGRQGLVQGVPGSPWLDPASGVIWCPLASATDETLSCFIAFDLRLDRVWHHVTEATYRFGLTYEATVRRRQLGLSWHQSSGHDAVPSAPRKTNGAPMAAWRYTDAEGRLVAVWAAATVNGVELRRLEADASWTNLHLFYASTLDGVGCTVRDARLLPPAGGRPACLVGSAVVSRGESDPELVVCVYRDLGALLDDAQELLNAPPPEGEGDGFFSPGLIVYLGAEGADAVYSGSAPALQWDGALPTVKLNCAATDTTGGALAVIVPGSELVEGGTGLPLVGVCHLSGFSLVQDATDPADAGVVARQNAAGTGGGPATLQAQPVAIALTSDADIGSSPRNGWAFVQEVDQTIDGELVAARVEVLSLPLGRIIHTLSPANVDLPADADPEGGGAAVIMAPPDMAAGVRLVWGYAVEQGLVEWDLWSASATSWSGPHFGGTQVTVNGWGLDLLTRLFVAGEPLLKWRRTAETDGSVTVTGVTPSVGFLINNPPGPVVSDALVDAGTTWTYDLEIRTNDGDSITLGGAFTYQADPETEQTLRRMLGRLPDEWIATDPKADTLQRHILLAAARLFTRFRSDALLPVFLGACISTAGTRALDLWGRHLRAPRPYPSMPDADYCTFLLAVLAFQHSGPTPTRMLDIIEPILGVRPTVEEGYRSITMTAALEGISAALDNHDWFGDPLAVDAEEQLARAFFDRDFYYGPDARVVGATWALSKYRPAGVRTNLTITLEPSE